MVAFGSARLRGAGRGPLERSTKQERMMAKGQSRGGGKKGSKAPKSKADRKAAKAAKALRKKQK